MDEILKQSTVMQVVSCDYPAAHSMDTHWFAIDEAGEVAMFDTHETGPVPVGPHAVDGIYNLPAFLNRDEYGIPILTAVFDPFSHGEVSRDVDRILSKLNSAQRAALDQLMTDRGLTKDQSIELKRSSLGLIWVWGVFVELLDAADSLEFSQDDTVIRIHDTRPVYHLFEGTATASALCLLQKGRVAAWRWATGDEYRYMAADVYGMYAFEQIDQALDVHEYLLVPTVPPPYGRYRVPRVPRQGLATGVTMLEQAAPVYSLPGVSFAVSERVQVADSIVCNAWGEGLLEPTQGEVRVRQYLISYYEGDQATRQALISNLRSLAEQNDLIAQYVLGCIYGRSDVAKPEESARWFEAAARQAELQSSVELDMFDSGAAAQYCLSDAYERGCGVPQDEALAIQWLERASERGLGLAMYRLGLRYKNGIGVITDALKARRLLRAAAVQGHYEAAQLLKSYPDFEGANAGDAVAQYELAEMYAFGRSVERNAELAAHWYGAAAEQGSLRAVFALEEVLTKDPASPARKFISLVLTKLKASAEAGNQLSQYKWGKSLLTGIFGEVDIDMARQWLSAASKGDGIASANDLLRKTSIWPEAKAGDARAGYNLAWLFEELKNYSHAVLWYRKVIDVLERKPVDSANMFENGSAAKCNLADKYEHGLGVPQDYQLAVYWYQQSAAQNNCVAQYSLGNMYRQGLGVPRDLKAARQWLSKSAAQGYTNAQDVLDGLPEAP